MTWNSRISYIAKNNKNTDLESQLRAPKNKRKNERRPNAQYIPAFNRIYI